MLHRRSYCKDVHFANIFKSVFWYTKAPLQACGPKSAAAAAVTSGLGSWWTGQIPLQSYMPPSPRFQDADLILSSDALPEGAGACAVQPDPAKLRIPLTRLVATLGPNSNSVQALSSLLQAGMQARPAATGTGDAACADRRAGSA